VSTSTSPHRRPSSLCLVVDFAGPLESPRTEPANVGSHCRYGPHSAQSSIGRERLVVCRRIFGGWGPRI
jgi:hypothetical protein